MPVTLLRDPGRCVGCCPGRGACDACGLASTSLEIAPNRKRMNSALIQNMVAVQCSFVYWSEIW